MLCTSLSRPACLTIPSCRSFLLPVFLAEFPSGAWVPSKSTYLPRFSSPHEKEPEEGHLLIFRWHRWPNVDGANSLSWNFIGIPRKPSYSAPFFLSYYFLAEFPSGAWVPTKPINFAWASKIRPGGPQCLLSFGRTGRYLQPT